MKMRKSIVLFMAFALSAGLLAGCKSETKPVADETHLDTETMETAKDYCCVYLDDGDLIEYPVEAYGEEFVLPESKNTEAEGTFYGWLGEGQIYQPGDKVIAKEYAMFNALRSDPEAGTLIAVHKKGSYAVASTAEMIVTSPYNDYDDACDDEYFDHWVDQYGDTYEGGELVTVPNNEMLLLNAVYSNDLSGAYKVEVKYNTDMEDEDDMEYDTDMETFDFYYYRYVKKGCSIPLELRIEPAGVYFDGWYDAPEGGNLVADDREPFTPESDIVLYAHWTE